jgi:hypothetical protein
MFDGGSTAAMAVLGGDECGVACASLRLEIGKDLISQNLNVVLSEVARSSCQVMPRFSKCWQMCVYEVIECAFLQHYTTEEDHTQP